MANTSRESRFKWLAVHIGRLIAAIIFLVVVTLTVAGLRYATKASERTAAGTLPNTSLYVAMGGRW